MGRGEAHDNGRSYGEIPYPSPPRAYRRAVSSAPTSATSSSRPAVLAAAPATDLRGGRPLAREGGRRHGVIR
jgi:hypothetical protein